MSKINDLISAVKTGLRKNKYRVLFPVDGQASSKMDVLCHTTTLPGRTLTPTEVIIKGKKVQIAGETSLEGTWEATFYNNREMEVRRYFTKWMEDIHSLGIADPNDGLFGLSGINNFISRVKDTISDVKNSVEKIGDIINDPLGALFDDSNLPLYQRDITIQQLGNSDLDIPYQVTLIGAFPITIDAIDYDDSSGEVSTTTVTFSYTDILIGNIEGRSTSQNFLGDELGGLVDDIF